MGVNTGRFAKLALVIVIFTGIIGIPSPASAAPARLHVIQFNACDQYQAPSNSTPACNQNTVGARAAGIIDYIESFDADVVTLQEICLSTFLFVKQGLPGWTGFHHATLVLSATDNRCGVGTSHEWGIAILTKGSTAVGRTDHALPSASGQEPRALLCANTTIGTGFKFCSTHLAAGASSLTIAQAAEVARQLNAAVSNGAAVILGADLNINALSCPTTGAQGVGVLYYYNYTPPPYNYCSSNRGNFFEADAPNTSAGDGVYNAGTFDAQFSSDPKFDYAFMNRQMFGTNYGAAPVSSAYSDHKYYKAAMTVQ